MRGKQWFFYFTPLCVGITPADAGKTQPYVHCLSSIRDHPRGCGENQNTAMNILLATGSPPRMRGKLTARCGKKYPDRITPADAGKTLAFSASRTYCWDHPRGCGENFPDYEVSNLGHGSPPRMRGKLFEFILSFLPLRITPADAGKTLRQGLPTVRHRDHPRGCGENVFKSVGRHFCKGSPPRMRGKPEGISKYGDYGRITPADAGKTCRLPVAGITDWDHPRGCGENCDFCFCR